MSDVELRLPYPPPELNPNRSRRLHWAVRRKHTLQYREVCFFVAKEAMQREPGPFPLQPKVEAEVLFLVADRCRRDVDNLLASIKPAWDGMVDAGLLEDDRAGLLKIASADLVYHKSGAEVRVRLRSGSLPRQMEFGLA